ncbi:MAG TPA: hypothetical protein VIK77_05875 [Tissierellaceae bacterium]
MKKLKFVLSGLILIVLLGFSLVFVPIGVKANDITETWGAPEAAKNFMDKDGKGIRLCVERVYADNDGNFTYAEMRAIKDYSNYFEDEDFGPGGLYSYGRGWFDSDLIDGYLTDYIDRWGSGELIPDWDRTYVYFDVADQVFMFEFHGTTLAYAAYWNEQYMSLFDDFGYDEVFNYGYNTGYSFGYDEGYDEGYNEGYQTGYDEGYDLGHDTGYGEGILVGAPEAYERGYSDGQKSKLAENNEKFYNGIEKWLVPAIIAVILLGGFVSIAVRKRKEE